MKGESRLRVIGSVLAVGGVLLLTALIVREGAPRVATALAAATWAFPAVAAINTLRVFSDGAAWLALIPKPNRPRFLVAVWVRWLGGSVNDLLPFARLGADILTARLATISASLTPSLAASVSVVNLTISVFMRILVTVAALLLLAVATGRGNLSVPTLVAGLAAAGVVFGFYVLQRFGVVRLIASVVSRLTKFSRLSSVLQRGANFDQTVRALYARRLALLTSCTCWTLSWLIGCLQTWITLFALGIQASFIVALIIETAGQGVRSVLFIVPAGLGVFEGGIVMISSLFGISGDSALALSLIRRATEVLFNGSGLLGWQIVEARRVLGRVTRGAESTE
jgi:putative membrane protein